MVPCLRIHHAMQGTWVLSLIGKLRSHQLVKNPPEMWETWLQSLGWEDPLEKGKATYPSILAWRIPYSPGGRKEPDTTERLSLSRCEGTKSMLSNS